MPREVTREFIDEGRSGPGGWSRRQLELIGEAWPSKTGWKDRAIGRTITDEAAAEFLALRKPPEKLREQRNTAIENAMRFKAERGDTSAALVIALWDLLRTHDRIAEALTRLAASKEDRGD